ncbi:DNA topoisomerase IB [Aestuariivirga sp.]|uniref:DNA topoisomerase IB n=1 Tax=Aestuariivirga sp. TaxID=2650926 RepID=UPI00391B4AE4
MPDDGASAAGLEAPPLVYVSDAAPGLRRIRRGKGFSYLMPDGTALTDPAELARIRSLAIPPAWRDVWICPDPCGHIQATGRDQKHRKQYRYHKDWHGEQDAGKFARLVEFARALPAIRARVSEDMGKRGISRDKVLAAVVDLLDRTLIRIGNAEYARGNDSYGLTTLQNRHVKLNGSELHFRFKGKSGKIWSLRISDRRIARIVRTIQDLPGQDLFQYLDEEGQVRDVDSAAVNAYIRELAGPETSAKDFRTWNGTVMAARALAEAGSFTSKREAASKLKAAIAGVAERLGNTVTVCRSSYVHPAVIEGWLSGGPCAMPEKAESRGAGLSTEEEAVLRFLEAARGR